MSLLDQLRTAGQALDPQFQPSQNEIASVLGALVYYTEHGDDFLKAADDNGVEGTTELIAPKPSPEDGTPAAAGPSTQPAAGPVDQAEAASDDELRKQIADLEAQLATREATAKQTQLAEHTTEEGSI